MIISLPTVLLITVLSFPLQVKTEKKKKNLYICILNLVDSSPHSQ